MGDGERYTGYVKTLVTEKGFGFIRIDDTTNDVFLHRSAMAHGEFDQLRENDRLSFETEPGKDPKKGPRAKDHTVERL